MFAEFWSFSCHLIKKRPDPDSELWALDSTLGTVACSLKLDGSKDCYRVYSTDYQSNPTQGLLLFLLQLALPAPRLNETTDAALTDSHGLNGIYFDGLLDVDWEILAQLAARHRAYSKGHLFLSDRAKESSVRRKLMF